MKVVLKKDVSGLGGSGDVVEVADGYARNYLLPQALALKATSGVMAQADSMRRRRQLRDSRNREAADEIARTLASRTVVLSAHAGEDGKLFGSVTAQDIVDALNSSAGVNLDRRMVALDEPLKSVGSHTVVIRLHPQVTTAVVVEVEAD